MLVQCVRALRDSGSIFWQVGAFADKGRLVPLDVRYFCILEDLGMIPRNRIIWARQHGLHATRKFSCRHETVLWFTKSDGYEFNLDAVRVPQKYQNKKAWTGDRKGEFTCHPDGKNPGDIWVFRNVKHNHEEQTIHPCQFPEDMIARIVLATTDRGDVVLDPYMGTGTVAVVARDPDRHFLGAELDDAYWRAAMQRLSGEPDPQGVFANLKCLRRFCRRTGADPRAYRFATQTADSPSLESKAFDEPHHLDEMFNRLAFEEGCFGADIRQVSRPSDPDPGSARRTLARRTGLSLFDT